MIGEAASRSNRIYTKGRVGEVKTRPAITYRLTSDTLPCAIADEEALSTSWKSADGHLPREATGWYAGGEKDSGSWTNTTSKVLLVLLDCLVFSVKLTMPVAKRAWDAQEPKDQAMLVW